ncbi:DUF423 domain-containing protein [uncultured Thiohalocapsa sp.]|uniref:DUF423 domain-containing protein n=1 Tax=uncultured Thiohalocapsa sp. TaxID=768990 RepID=UPI0025FCD1D4|nr:DUF423 domain-containing protein [uncultured Thiohalocapsa sp.]
MSRSLVVIAALFGLIAVLFGAFGAHGLEGRVSAQRLAVWETGAHYLGWHATTLLAVALLRAHRPGLLLNVAAWTLAAGAGVFSGSLFLLVLTDTPAWGAVTPIGGLALAVGWGALALAAVLGRDTDTGPRSPAGE